MKNYALIALLALAVTPLFAADEPEASTAAVAAQKLVSGLNFQKGVIELKSGLAKITVPEDFRYLNPKDTETVLTRLWGNPRGSDTLGMLVPTQTSLASNEGWGVIITYDEDGYVKDNDAAKLDYPKLLKEMQASTAESNKARQKEGYPGIELVGWAQPPHYDAATHKLYWAKELKFEGSDASTLNYCIRMLGRRGVLQLNGVAGMAQLQQIEAVTPSVLAMVDFQEGHRYADFNAKTDKVATYGLAALVVGGLAGKAGLFKGLLVGLLAAKKFVIIGFIAVVSFFKKLFGKKEEA